MRRLFIFALLLILVTCAAADPRQWGEAGIPIRQSVDVEWRGSAAQDEAGNTLVVWTDMRAGSLDIYAQLLDPSGETPWDSAGVVVVNHPANQNRPATVAVPGGWIVVWIDHRHDSGIPEDPGYGDIYAQKLDNTGQRLWPAESYGGMPVDSSESGVYYGVDESLVSDGSGGALVVWLDSHQLLLSQHLSADGSLLWADPVPLFDEPQPTSDFAVCSDGAGDLLAACRLQHAVKATKITGDGQRPWGPNGRTVVDNLSGYAELDVCGDSDHGCYIAWSTGSSGETRAQRLDSDGQNQWPTQGVRLGGGGADLALAPSFDQGLADGGLCIWYHWSGATAEVWVQKISPAGEPSWTASGWLLTSGSDAYPTALVSDLAGGLIAAWRSYDVHNSVFAARVTAAGTRPWGEQGIQVFDPARDQWQGAVMPPVDGHVQILCTERKPGATSLRYQHLDLATGASLFPLIGREVVAGIAGDAYDPQAICLSPGRMALVWCDLRPVWGYSVAYQIFDTSGHPVMPVNGATLNNASVRNVAVCSDDAGGFLVAFADLSSGTARVRLTRVNSSGAIVGPDSGTLVHQTADWSDQDRPLCAPDGLGGCFVAWEAYDPNFCIDLLVQRLDANCNLLWTSPLRLTNSENDDILQGLVPSLDNSCIVVWRAVHTESQDTLFAAEISADGSVAWCCDVCPAAQPSYDPLCVIPDDAGGLYCAWEDERAAPHGRDIYVQHVSADGDLWWGETGVPAATGTSEQYAPVLGSDRSGNLFVGWTVFTPPSEEEFWLQKVNPSGQRIWEETGRAICTSYGSRSNLSVVADGRDGLFASWTEYATSSSVRATHLDSAGAPVGDPYWIPAAGGLISDTVTHKYAPVLVLDGLGGAVVAWQDMCGLIEEHSAYQIYAQRIFDGFTPVREHSREVPARYVLYQNYPNPFNPRTVITFALPRSGDTHLSVYNLLGRKVTDLVNGPMTAGEHQISFDASDLPSGVYFYRLESGPFSQSRKMVVLK